MFKAGDKLRFTEDGDEITILLVEGNHLESTPSNGGCTNWTMNYLKENARIINTSLTNKQMGIKEQFVLALTPEPKKSFRKAGITNGDDLLTAEGQQIFLTWLLHTKHSDEFKTSVVDGLLADQSQEKNN
jgi:hypothetical protein